MQQRPPQPPLKRAKPQVLVALDVISVSYTHLDVYKRQVKANDKDKEKLRQVERFFMSKEADDIRRNNARERFNNEIRALKEAEKLKKRRFNRIDGAFRLVSVGAGLLAGGCLLYTSRCV